MTALQDAPSSVAAPPSPRQADRLYHDMLSPAEVLTVRQAVREVATEVIAPVAAAIANGDERVDGFPRATFDAPGPVEAIYRDSKIGEIYEGANEVQRWVIARQIFGRDITG